MNLKSVKFDASLATYTGITYVLSRRKVNFVRLEVQVDEEKSP